MWSIVGPILLAWELGSGMGHLLPHRTLIRHLLERGHTVHVAPRDVGRAGVAFDGLSFPHWPVPLTLDLPRRVYQPTITRESKRCQEPFPLTAYLKMHRLRKWEDKNEPLRVVGFTTF